MLDVFRPASALVSPPHMCTRPQSDIWSKLQNTIISTERRDDLSWFYLAMERNSQRKPRHLVCILQISLLLIILLSVRLWILQISWDLESEENWMNLRASQLVNRVKEDEKWSLCGGQLEKLLEVGSHRNLCSTFQFCWLSLGRTVSSGMSSNGSMSV